MKVSEILIEVDQGRRGFLGKAFDTALYGGTGVMLGSFGVKKAMDAGLIPDIRNKPENNEQRYYRLGEDRFYKLAYDQDAEHGTGTLQARIGLAVGVVKEVKETIGSAEFLNKAMKANIIPAVKEFDGIDGKLLSKYYSFATIMEDILSMRTGKRGTLTSGDWISDRDYAVMLTTDGEAKVREWVNLYKTSSPEARQSLNHNVFADVLGLTGFLDASIKFAESAKKSDYADLERKKLGLSTEEMPAAKKSAPAAQAPSAPKPAAQAPSAPKPAAQAAAPASQTAKKFYAVWDTEDENQAYAVTSNMREKLNDYKSEKVAKNGNQVIVGPFASAEDVKKASANLSKVYFIPYKVVAR